jgi:hypothetical protein
MKQIFILILMTVSAGFTALAQADSSKAKITVSIQARDCEYIAALTNGDNIMEDIDSVLKKRWRPASQSPSGNTLVSVDSIELRAWREVVKRLRAQDDGDEEFGRVDAVLRATNNTWLIDKLNKDSGNLDDISSEKRQYGRSRLKKEL